MVASCQAISKTKASGLKQFETALKVGKQTDVVNNWTLDFGFWIVESVQETVFQSWK